MSATRWWVFGALALILVGDSPDDHCTLDRDFTLAPLLVLVLGHVRPADDHLVDVRPGVVLGLDRLFLGGVQEVIEELPMNLQQFFAREQPTVGVRVS